MKKSTKETNGSKAETVSALDELIQQGARQMIQQAVEAELASMLEQYSNVKSIDGRRAVVRNGYLPEREGRHCDRPGDGSGAKSTGPLRVRASSLIRPSCRRMFASPRVYRRHCRGCICVAFRPVT